MSRGQLVIISGPSGAGKSTVVKRLIDECELPLRLSVSATTREKRPGEVDGVHYHFINSEEFEKKRHSDDFLECMEVFGRGDWYGTLQSEVEDGLEAGQWVILEIDVQGALKVMEKCPDAVSIFIHPGSLAELETRLRSRATDSEDAIKRRLEVAAEELRAITNYQHEIVNSKLDETIESMCELLVKAARTQGLLQN